MFDAFTMVCSKLILDLRVLQELANTHTKGSTITDRDDLPLYLCVQDYSPFSIYNIALLKFKHDNTFRYFSQ